MRKKWFTYEKRYHFHMWRKKTKKRWKQATIGIVLLTCVILLVAGVYTYRHPLSHFLVSLLPEQKAENTAADGANVKDLAYTPSSAIDRISVTFGRDPMTEKAFTWYTPEYFLHSSLQLVKLSEGEKASKANFDKAVTYTGENGIAINSPEERWHKVVAMGLSPKSTYAFRVGDIEIGEWSKIGTFTTAPESHSALVNFVCITDTQAENQAEAEVSANTWRQALKTAPDPAFVVLSGDVTFDAGSEEQWKMILNSAMDSLMKSTLVPASGNHDSNIGCFSEHFNLPVPEGEDVSTGAYYSFDYGSVHMITLNTNDTANDYASISPAQIDWLWKDIQAARIRGAGWIVVNMHISPYTLGYHATEEEMAAANGKTDRISPILESLGVDLVLQGHDHVLSRTYPLMGGVPAAKGTTYLCLNTAGVLTYPQNPKLSQNYLSKFAFRPNNAGQTGRYQDFAVITAGADTLSGVIYEIDQNKSKDVPIIVDHFTIKKGGTKETN